MLRAFLLSFLLAFTIAAPSVAQDVLIPMDERQSDHLKAYGAMYWLLERGQSGEWLLNYRGGSFLAPHSAELEEELHVRGVSYEILPNSEAQQLLRQVDNEAQNTAPITLETAPRVAVYAPDQTLPWDDAVLLSLNYAEIPYDLIYDDEVLNGELDEYDWLHLHHEDFTGQYSKFIQYQRTDWYQEQKLSAEAAAREHGFERVSELKLAVVSEIRSYIERGGFMFAMCLGTDTFDIALAARHTDIVPAEYDGFPAAPDALEQLDYSQTLAFENFTPVLNPYEGEHADINTGLPPPEIRDPSRDYFTLFDFSAQWDPVPSMLTQNHVSSIRGFVGQTTAFRREFIKDNVVILAEAPDRNAVRYLHGTLGEGSFAFYSGHDPEDYQHFVGDPPTDLSLHKNSPGYRLILNNVLFPAAEEKEQKT